MSLERKKAETLVLFRISAFIGLLWNKKWWRRRESNPRPKALYRQFYILSPVIYCFNLGYARRTG